MSNQTFDQHVRKEMIVNVVINVVINCTIIWLLKRHSDIITAHGDQGFRVDIFATAFLLFFLMSLAVISIHRAQHKANKLPEFHINPQNWRHKLFDRMPRSVWVLALGFGLFGLLVIAPISVGLLAVFGVSELTPISYTIFKGMWVAIIVAVINRPIIEAALIKSAPLKSN